MAGDSGRRLLPEERDRIIELKLSRVPVRAIAAQVGTTTATVQKVWKKHLADNAKARAGRLESERSEVLLRLDQVAADARRGFEKAMENADFGAAARFLAEERQAIGQRAKSTGLDVQKIDVSGQVDLRAITWVEELAAPVEGIAQYSKPAIENTHVPLSLPGVEDAEIVEAELVEP